MAGVKAKKNRSSSGKAADKKVISVMPFPA